jgi:HK97 family phage portal protein
VRIKIPFTGRSIELRFKLSEDPEKWFVDMTGPRSSSGLAVNEESAMRCAAVFACVRVLAESVAQIPLKVYEKLPDGGKKEVTDHQLYPLLHTRPNDEMTSFSWRETSVGHLATHGNAYSLLEHSGDGRVRSIYPLRPDRVTPRRNISSGKIVYDVTDDEGRRAVYHKEQILHVPGLGYDGIIGYSPIRMAAESIGMEMAAAQYSGKFFANGAMPGGVLEHPGALGAEALQALRESWEEIHKGGDNAHKIAILEEGMKYTQISIKPEEAQLLDTLKFSRSEIAGIYRVPAHMINDLEKATFSNVEQLSLEFVKFSLSPWLSRMEQAMNWRLFLPSERGRYFCEFVLDGLLRGDYKSRNEGHQIAISGGWKSINEVRAEENLPPVEGGDSHFMQGAMTTVERIVSGEGPGKGGDDAGA